MVAQSSAMTWGIEPQRTKEQSSDGDRLDARRGRRAQHALSPGFYDALDLHTVQVAWRPVQRYSSGRFMPKTQSRHDLASLVVHHIDI